MSRDNCEVCGAHPNDLCDDKYHDAYEIGNAEGQKQGEERLAQQVGITKSYMKRFHKAEAENASLRSEVERYQRDLNKATNRANWAELLAKKPLVAELQLSSLKASVGELVEAGKAAYEILKSLDGDLMCGDPGKRPARNVSDVRRDLFSALTKFQALSSEGKK